MLASQVRKYTMFLNLKYGNPVGSNNEVNPKWAEANLTSIQVPWQMVLAWQTSSSVKSIRCHKKVVSSLEKVFKEIKAQARIRAKDKHGYNLTSAQYDKLEYDEIKAARLHLFGGMYNFRKQRGSNKLSLHSYGIAIDLDPANNALGDTTPLMPMWVVDIFERNGWSWGGRWKGSRCDGMHFELR